MAQPIPGFLEGPLTDLDVVSRTARVNGVLMNIPPGTPIASPTVDLNALAASLGVDPLTLIGGDPLPGRTTPGFTGGTCLCAVEVDPATGVATATEMTLEPAENVILATVTAHNCVTPGCDPDDDPANELRVGGTLMDPNPDPRLTSDPATNRGFVVDLTLGNLAGVAAGGEGYFGVTGNLHLYTLELEGGVLVNAGVTEVSILRAQCRQRNGMGEWNVLGATHDPSTGEVTVRRGDTGEVLGTAPVVADPDDPAFGAYTFNAEVTGTCAGAVIVDFLTASATGDVDVRIDDPAAPPPPPGGGPADAIAIDRARFRADKGMIRVSGTVLPGGATPPAAVEVYVPGTDDGAGGCSGTLAGTATVDAVALDWDFRSNDGDFPTNPGTTCVASPNGGSAESDFTVD
ncbi:MAG: hypothetical protein D6696_09805 [Acidobacteria bacterium]|nr:MAG: hypothetical protein D6696_09805 [Acidobacteriota bacterium]